MLLLRQLMLDGKPLPLLPTDLEESEDDPDDGPVDADR